MNSCWQNTPTEIVNHILKLACSRLIYRDGKYLEIGQVPRDTKCLECIKRKIQVTDKMVLYGNRGWDLSFHFPEVTRGMNFIHVDNHFEITYWFTRETNARMYYNQVRTIVQ